MWLNIFVYLNMIGLKHILSIFWTDGIYSSFRSIGPKIEVHFWVCSFQQLKSFLKKFMRIWNTRKWNIFVEMCQFTPTPMTSMNGSWVLLKIYDHKFSEFDFESCLLDCNYNFPIDLKQTNIIPIGAKSIGKA